MSSCSGLNGDADRRKLCEAAKARQAVVVWFDEHGQFAAVRILP